MTTNTARFTVTSVVGRARARATDLRVGGGLLLLAGATIFMGIITAEALYPGSFSTGANEISDLGGRDHRTAHPPAIGDHLQPGDDRRRDPGLAAPGSCSAPSGAVR